MLHTYVLRHISRDVRRLHCILCKEEIMNWADHVLSARHIALRSLGNNFYSFNPPKSRRIFEAGLQSALGVSSSVLAKERKPVVLSRRKCLQTLISHILSLENYPMKHKDSEKNISIGGKVLQRESIFLICRLHPNWSALQIKSLVDTISSKKHLLHITNLLSIDTEFFDLEATVGHLNNVQYAKPQETILSALAKHAIARIVFELYDSFIWESMNHLTTVWEIYLSARRELIEETQRPVQFVNALENLDTNKVIFTTSKKEHQSNQTVPAIEHFPWQTPRGCVSYHVPATQISSKISKLDRTLRVKKGTFVPSLSLKIESVLKCVPHISAGRKRKSNTLKYLNDEEQNGLVDQCRAQLSLHATC